MEGIENNQEKMPSKDEVTQSLRENKEDTSVLMAWYEGRQAEIREDDTGAVIEFNRELADVYQEAGLFDMAIEAYTDLETLARNTGNTAVEREAQTCIVAAQVLERAFRK